MRAEVICVGTELLLGDVVNSNAAVIARALAEAGVNCHHQVAVGDNEERIAEAITTALGRAEAVIVTGGLGPTQDDVTREALSRATGRPVRRDSDLEHGLRERFARLGRPMPVMNLRQADVPEGARVIEQTWGTAPGLIVEQETGVVYAIPGVPSEMRDMLDRAVIPDLVRRGSVAAIRSRVVRVAGMSESGVAEALAPVWRDAGEGVTVAFLAGGGEVRVRLTSKSPDATTSNAMLDDAEVRVRGVLGRAVVSGDGRTLEAVVGDLVRARGWSLGCAESVTGGLLGGRVTSVPGASEWFRGSIVAYAPEAKERLLGVSRDLLDVHGPVSVPVAEAMAAGARARLGCDVAVALTGSAGPLEQGRPVGTIIMAVESPLGAAVREVALPGDRETVRALAVAAALNLVRLHVAEALP